MIVCLEAIVRTVRIDGTAVRDEVETKYLEMQARDERSATAQHDVAPRSEAEMRAELIEAILPRLAAAELIGLPTGDLAAPDSTISIASPLLRMALLESGLIQHENGAAEALSASRALSTRASNRLSTSNASSARHSDEWAQLWFAIQRFRWTSLVIVPAAPGTSGLASAMALVAAGRQFQEGGVQLVDATGVAPRAVDLIIASISGAPANGTQLVIALDCPIDNPAAIPIARHVGVALLAVPLVKSSLDESRRVVDYVGRQYFIGSVALRAAT